MTKLPDSALTPEALALRRFRAFKRIERPLKPKPSKASAKADRKASHHWRQGHKIIVPDARGMIAGGLVSRFN